MKTINLLPKEVKVRDIRSIILNIVLVLFVAAVILLVALLVFLYDVNSNIVPKSEEYSRVNSQMNNYIAKLETYEKFKDNVKVKSELVDTLQKDEILWSEILYDFGEKIPEGAYINYIDCDSKQLYEFINKSPEEKKADNKKKIFFLIGGYANDYNDITKLKIEIESIPHTGEVLINNIAKDQITESNIEVVSFTISVYYDMGPYMEETENVSEVQTEETGEEDVLESEVNQMEQQ